MGMEKGKGEVERFSLHSNDYGLVLDPRGEYCRHAEYAKLAAELATNQAMLDRLMLEHCPWEMTSKQKADWAKHQRVAVTDREE